jgi:anti-anti-sigma factor
MTTALAVVILFQTPAYDPDCSPGAFRGIFANLCASRRAGDRMGDESAISAEEFAQLVQAFSVRSAPSDDDRYAIRLETDGSCLVLVIEGMLLQSVPDEFAERLHRIFVHEQARQVIIDMSRVAYISSAIMGFLHQFFDSTAGRSGRLVLVSPTDKVRKMMAIVGLYEYFVVLDSMELALEYHRQVERGTRGEDLPQTP